MPRAELGVKRSPVQIRPARQEQRIRRQPSRRQGLAIAGPGRQRVQTPADVRILATRAGPLLRSGGRSTSWLTCLVLRSPRHERHERRLGVPHGNTSGCGTVLDRCLVGNGEISRCGGALNQAGQRFDQLVRSHHFDCIGIRWHRPRPGRHRQAEVRKGHRPEVRERIGLVGARIAGILCYPLGGRAWTRVGLGGCGGG